MDRKQSLAILLLMLIPTLALAGSEKGAPSSRETSFVTAKGQTIYVPVYSHIFSGNRETHIYLAATLSIRNVDPLHAITIQTADYYDSKGNLVTRFLKQPQTLKPHESTYIVIKQADKSGGAGAHFIVRWIADQNVNSPLTESIMISTSMQQGLSFTSRGIIISEHDME